VFTLLTLLYLGDQYNKRILEAGIYKSKVDIAVRGNHTVLPATVFPTFTPDEAGTHLATPEGCKAELIQWWLYRKIVYTEIWPPSSEITGQC